MSGDDPAPRGRRITPGRARTSDLVHRARRAYGHLMTRADLVPLLRTERDALAGALTDLPRESWEHPTLCRAWSVHEVLTHLTAAASTRTLPWFVNMAITRFDTDRHNQRLLRRHWAPDPETALAEFRAIAPSAVAPFGELAGALGEVVVHGQDIARPLGLPFQPSREAARIVAEFFAGKDFAVPSRTLVTGLRLEAADDSFTTGEGPVVRGALLDLVMAMAGRPSALDVLEGDGVEKLRERLTRP